MYSEEELNISIRTNTERCIKFIKRNENIFEEYYAVLRKNAESYYKNIIRDNNERIVVFDIGYSGSVSLGLTTLSGKITDKIYLSERDKNILNDCQRGTYTYLIKNGSEHLSHKDFELFFEEIFSPLESSCKGFIEEDGQIVPFVNRLEVSKQMKQLYQKIENLVLEYTQNYINVMGTEAEYIYLSDINELFYLLRTFFMKNKKLKNLFNVVIFEDSICLHKQKPLSSKIKIKNKLLNKRSI